MESSDWLRRGALAPAGIEIGAASGAQPRTIFPTEEVAGRRQRQLLPHYPGEIDRGGCRRHHVDGWIVGRIGIVAEEDVYLFVDMMDHVRQAAPAIGANVGSQPGSPKVLARPGGLEPTRDRDRSGELELESMEGRIARLEPPGRVNRTSIERPEVDLKHSRLT
jgi:hypothetical protein